MESETESENSSARCMGVMAASNSVEDTHASVSNVAEIDNSVNEDSAKKTTKTTKRKKKKSVEARLTEFEGKISLLTKLVLELKR